MTTASLHDVVVIAAWDDGHPDATTCTADHKISYSDLQTGDAIRLAFMVPGALAAAVVVIAAWDDDDPVALSTHATNHKKSHLSPQASNAIRCY